MKVEPHDAAKRRKKSKETDILMELPSDVPSVDGTVFDPVPAPIYEHQHEQV